MKRRSSLYLKPGEIKPEEIISGIDSASGDFSIPAAGFMIDKGKLAFPVRGIKIGGNLFELHKAADKIGGSGK